ncbi:uncharacterized protein LOC128589789 [Nycticebus coucang]|uniref:uncharacterized protein LOC128589789 n=1 Tax=Nycticebus coucang TaxID=9470 RepID=UPI00234C92A3|nr:uncharacterized protein LOC128589789 [Nycticebus coucang]
MVCIGGLQLFPGVLPGPKILFSSAFSKICISGGEVKTATQDKELIGSGGSGRRQSWNHSAFPRVPGPLSGRFPQRVVFLLLYVSLGVSTRGCATAGSRRVPSRSNSARRVFHRCREIPEGRSCHNCVASPCSPAGASFPSTMAPAGWRASVEEADLVWLTLLRRWAIVMQKGRKENPQPEKPSVLTLFRSWAPCPHHPLTSPAECSFVTVQIGTRLSLWALALPVVF